MKPLGETGSNFQGTPPEVKKKHMLVSVRVCVLLLLLNREAWLCPTAEEGESSELWICHEQVSIEDDYE